MHAENGDGRWRDSRDAARLPERNRSDKAELFDHFARQARQRERHIPRDSEALVLCDPRRLALLALDIPGVAKLTHDSLELIVHQLGELLDERADGGAVTTHQLTEGRAVRELLRGAHSRDTRIDPALTFIIENSEPIRDR